MTSELQKISKTLNAKNIVGESIVWCDQRQTLFWVDIVGSRIHSWSPVDGKQETWTTPEYPTSIGLRRDGGFILGLRQRICLWSPGSDFETFAVPEPDADGNRLNEGVVAPDGSFWVGTMQENIGPRGNPLPIETKSGFLYKVDHDGSVLRLSDHAFGITNTMVWSDRNTFITADTLTNEMFEFDLDADKSKLSNRRSLPDFALPGSPDGSTRSRDGDVFNARVAGGCGLARISSNFESATMIPLDCTSPTSCIFGGENLDKLYVTSARFGLSEEAIEQNSLEGGVFEVDTGAVGIPAVRFNNTGS